MKYFDLYPSKKGYFGDYGGRFVPETVIPALIELEDAYHNVLTDNTFKNELNKLLKSFEFDQVDPTNADPDPGV